MPYMVRRNIILWRQIPIILLLKRMIIGKSYISIVWVVSTPLIRSIIIYWVQS